MAIERTEASKFKSPNSGEFCTGEQYIAELLMTRNYEFKKEKLPFKFWQLDKYKKEFVKHIIAINRLTKVYPAETIIKVLLSTGNWIRYVCKAIDDLVEKEIDRESKEKTCFNLEIGNVESLPKNNNKDGILGKLR